MSDLDNRPKDKVISPKGKVANTKDVRFVLNWGNLGADRIEEVVHSYKSGGFQDYLNGHAIRVSHLDVSDLANSGRDWHRGDELSGVAKDAVDFVALCLTSQEMPWFPTIDEMRSPTMYVYVWKIVFVGVDKIRPNAADVIFANPDTKMVYYLSGKI